MADMTTIKERIAETIYPNGTGAITAASHQQLLLDMVDDFNEKKQDAEAGKGLVSDVERKQWNEKAEVDGRYPSMSVGFSDQLAGHGESTPAEFSFRASGGRSILDGVARIKELRGNAVVWNQMVQAIDGTNYGYRAKRENGKIILTNVSASTPDYGNIAIIQGWIPIVGHKYILLSDAPSSIQICYSSTNGFVGYANTISTAPSLDYSEMYLRTSAAPSLDLLPVGKSIEFTYVIHDLTLIFGSGNEPTTIEEFYSRCPIGVDMNAYNEGEMIADTSTAIKSIGDNAWDEQWELGTYSIDDGSPYYTDNRIRNKNPIRVLPNTTYYGLNGDVKGIGSYVWGLFYDSNDNFIKDIGGEGINYLSINNRTFTTPTNAAYLRFYIVDISTYNNDITISLYHSGWKAEVDNVYKPYVEDTREIDQRILDAFPNGRRPWDKVYNKNGKGYIVKGTGVADLGSMGWGDGFGGFIAGELQPLIKPATNYEVSESIVCAKYAVVGMNSSDVGISVIYAGAGYDYNDFIKVHDTTYADAASFKSAMQGVMLWYELAQPEIIEYDEPFNLDYDVWDFGTEEAIAEGVSAPISANIIYLFNAVDMIRDHEARIAALEALITSLTNGGQ